MAKKKKSKRKIDVKRLLAGASGIGVAEVAGNEVEKLVSKQVADKILNSKLSEKGKIVAYRSAQAATRSGAAALATWGTCKIAKNMKVKDENLKAFRIAGYATSIIAGLRSLLAIKDGFGEGAQSPAALLVEERKRLEITAGSGQSNAFVTAPRQQTRAYVTTQNMPQQTSAYLVEEEVDIL